MPRFNLPTPQELGETAKKFVEDLEPKPVEPTPESQPEPAPEPPKEPS